MVGMVSVSINEQMSDTLDMSKKKMSDSPFILHKNGKLRNIC